MKILKPIGKFFKKTFEVLNGKKTLIGTGMHIAWFVANLAFKDMVDTGQYWEGHAYIGAITGTGLLHKGAKTDIGHKIINQLKK